MAQWLSWLERRPVTAEVESSSLFWVVCSEEYMCECVCRFCEPPFCANARMNIRYLSFSQASLSQLRYFIFNTHYK